VSECTGDLTPPPNLGECSHTQIELTLTLLRVLLPLPISGSITMATAVDLKEHIVAVVKTKATGEDFPIIATTHPDLEPFKADPATTYDRDTGSSEKRRLREDVTKEYAEFLEKNKDLTVEQKREMLLRPNPHRFVMFPIQHFPLWRAYKMHMAMFWVAEEIDLAQDIKDWDMLKPEEQHFLRHVLAFFAASDGIVSENLAQRFMNDVQIPEARSFYSFQVSKHKKCAAECEHAIR
jgi:hypothetical protein